MANTTNKSNLNVSSEILELNNTFSSNSINIISLQKENKDILKKVFNIYLNEIKELKNNSDYVTYSKKSLATIISVRLETKLNDKFSQLIKAIFVYYTSNSSLNLSDISINKFIKGMKLINSPKNSVTKFKSNNELETKLKELEKLQLKEKLAKLN